MRWPLALAFLLALSLAGFGLLAPWDERAGDWLLRFGCRPRTKAKIVVALLDEPTLRDWPEPLAFMAGRFARFAQATTEKGAKTVVIDAVPSFDSEDPKVQEGNLALSEALASEPGRVIIGASPSSGRIGQPTETVFALLASEGEAAQVTGAVDVFPAPDRVVRTYQSRVDGVPTLAALTYANQGRPLPDRPFLLDPTAEPLPTFSALDVMEGKVDVKDATVFFGPSADTLGDRQTLPLLGVVDGPSVHAQAYATLVDGRRIRALPVAARIMLAALFALLGGIVATRGTPANVVVSSVVAVAALVGLAVGATSFGALLPLPTHLASLGIGLAMGATGRAFLEHEERLLLRSEFGAMVSPKVLDRLLQGGAERLRKPDYREGTILFMDLRDSTARADGRPAGEIFRQFDDVFEGLVGAIEAEGGTVLRFLGDGFMAGFGVLEEQTDHAARAYAAALRLHEELNAYNRNCKEPWQMGVGVHSGIMVSGTLGGGRRREFTVIGDTVNVAARVGDRCKALNADLVVTEATLRAVPDASALKEASTEVLKGVAQVVPVRYRPRSL